MINAVLVFKRSPYRKKFDAFKIIWCVAMINFTQSVKQNIEKLHFRGRPCPP